MHPTPGMLMLRPGTSTLVAIALICSASGPAAAQIPPETSAWELVDLAPPAAPVNCGNRMIDEMIAASRKREQ